MKQMLGLGFIQSRRLIFTIGICFCASVFADIYRCVGLTGDIEFRDTPCENDLQRQEQLPYESRVTEAKVVKEEERKIRAIHRRIAAEKRELTRSQIRAEKKAEKEERKKEKLAERCEKSQEKIKFLEEELHDGCTIARCRQIRAELSRYRKMEKRQCGLG